MIQSFFKVTSSKSLYFYSIIIGLFSGLGAYLFAFGLAEVEDILLHKLVGLKTIYPPGEIAPINEFNFSNYYPYMILFLPFLGGLITGTITYFFCKEAEGSGTDAVIKAFHYGEGKMNTRIPFIKSLTTIITLSTGGSAGKEGPIAQIGAGFAVIIGKILKVGSRARRTILLSGMAAGLGAVFRAPFGGAITAVEVMYKEDIESDSLVPCIISSVTAYLLYISIAGPGSIFVVEDTYLHNYKEIFLYLILGIFCFFVGSIFIWSFNFITSLFNKLRIHPILKPALGGIPVGLIGYFFPQIIGSGFGILQSSISKQYMIQAGFLEIGFFFLLIAFLKIITTSFTVGSGGSGGLFAPSLFIGGMIGGFIGCLGKYFFPEWDIKISSFILVGMSSFFTGIARAPIGGMVMVCDLIGSYALLPPLMIVSILSFILSNKNSIYKWQVMNRFDSPAHDWDMNRDIMEKIPLRKYFSEFRKYAILLKDTLLSDAEDFGLKIKASDFIVINSNQEYIGVTSLRRFRLDNENRELVKNIVRVEDVSFEIPYVTPESSVGDALKVILGNDIDKVAVLENKKVIGYLRYIDLLNAYHTELRLYSRKEKV
jgi:CIC family chloride channel protein